MSDPDPEDAGGVPEPDEPEDSGPSQPEEPQFEFSDPRTADAQEDRETGDVTGDTGASAGDESRGSREAPLSDLRADIEQRREGRDPPDPEDVFEEANADPVLDGEAVWSDLLEGDQDAPNVIGFGETVAADDEEVYVIPDRVCHNCQYFGAPPELHCTHDGTSIRRIVDMTHFEVVDCPVVRNRSDLRQD